MALGMSCEMLTFSQFGESQLEKTSCQVISYIQVCSILFSETVVHFGSFWYLWSLAISVCTSRSSTSLAQNLNILGAAGAGLRFEEDLRILRGLYGDQVTFTNVQCVPGVSGLW